MTMRTKKKSQRKFFLSQSSRCTGNNHFFKDKLIKFWGMEILKNIHSSNNISLIASFKIFSQRYSNYLKTKFQKSEYNLYWGSKISDQEIKLYCNSKNIIIRTVCFLSTSYDIEISKGSLPKKHTCLFEITNKKDYKKLALRKISQYSKM